MTQNSILYVLTKFRIILILEQVIVIQSLVSFSEDMLNQEGEEEEGEAGVELEEVGKICKPRRDLGEH